MGKTIRKSGILCFGAAASQSSVALVPLGSTLADSLLGREGSFKVKLLQLSTALGIAQWAKAIELILALPHARNLI